MVGVTQMASRPETFADSVSSVSHSRSSMRTKASTIHAVPPVESHTPPGHPELGSDTS
ncbi:hypothetical protein PF003_g35403 [Phytophthora fragariae]|nr:hypothetical protein PF003_g35403 [Phytophthora fragariae]